MAQPRAAKTVDVWNVGFVRQTGVVPAQNVSSESG